MNFPGHDLEAPPRSRSQGCHGVKVQAPLELAVLRGKRVVATTQRTVTPHIAADSVHRVEGRVREPAGGKLSGLCASRRGQTDMGARGIRDLPISGCAPAMIAAARAAAAVPAQSSVQGVGLCSNRLEPVLALSLLPVAVDPKKPER